MEKASKKQLKTIRELLRKKEARSEAGLFVADGPRIVRDISKKLKLIESVIISDDFLDDEKNSGLITYFEEHSVPVFSTSRASFNNTSTLKNSQGIMALLRKPDFSGKEIPARKDSIVVLCDGIQDPGNLGAIMRSSSAFGADHVLFINGTADIFNPKIVRASSGTLLDVPSGECSLSELKALKQKGFRLLVSSADSKGAATLETVSSEKCPVILVFGNEGAGISGDIRKAADGFFTIPINRRVESLNVNAAVAITLYEFTRRRKS